MKYELLAVIHYTNTIWIYPGPGRPLDLRREVGRMLYNLIGTFTNAVHYYRRRY
jgi:hypothetical protein